MVCLPSHCGGGGIPTSQVKCRFFSFKGSRLIFAPVRKAVHFVFGDSRFVWDAKKDANGLLHSEANGQFVSKGGGEGAKKEKPKKSKPKKKATIPNTEANKHLSPISGNGSINDVMNKASENLTPKSKEWNEARQKARLALKPEWMSDENFKRIPVGLDQIRISTDPTKDLIAVGIGSNGKKVKYIYSAEYEAQQKAIKNERYERLKDAVNNFGSFTDSIRQAGAVDSADCLDLIRATGVRVGTQEPDEDDDDPVYGATKLEGRHVVINPDNSVKLVFTGKDKQHLDIAVEDPKVAEMLKKRKEQVGDKGRLFGKVNENKLSRYLKAEYGDDTKVKDLRTLKAGEKTREFFKGKPKFEGTKKDRKKLEKECSEYVCKFLGNTPSVCLKSYIPTGELDRYFGKDEK